VPSPLRRSVERASLPLITRLNHLPKVVPFLLLLALLVAGVFISGRAGFVLMMLGAAFVGWVLFLSWPRLNGSERIMRLALLLLAFALAIVQLFPRH
jgi:hypothetical protein